MFNQKNFENSASIFKTEKSILKDIGVQCSNHSISNKNTQTNKFEIVDKFTMTSNVKRLKAITNKSVRIMVRPITRDVKLQTNFKKVSFKFL